ncbi:MAG: hypothetical protein ACREPE_03570 [Lysobacter sp.]
MSIANAPLRILPPAFLWQRTSAPLFARHSREGGNPVTLPLLYPVERSLPRDSRQMPGNGTWEALNKSDARQVQRRRLLIPFMVRQAHHERNQLVQAFPRDWTPAIAEMTSIDAARLIEA